MVVIKCWHISPGKKSHTILSLARRWRWAESWELVTKSEHLLMWGCGPSLDTDCLIIRKLILRFYSDENIDWWRTLAGTGCIYGKQTRGRFIKLLKKVFWLKWCPIVINCLWHGTKRRLKSEGTLWRESWISLSCFLN